MEKQSPGMCVDKSDLFFRSCMKHGVEISKINETANSYILAFTFQFQDWKKKNSENVKLMKEFKKEIRQCGRKKI